MHCQRGDCQRDGCDITDGYQASLIGHKSLLVLTANAFRPLHAKGIPVTNIYRV